MMKILTRAMVVGAVSAGALLAQTHKVEKPQAVVRAVGVYEWTGDMAKPTASRLIPVTVFIDGALQDAGVYLARPVPFALDTGNVYELQASGVPKGTLDLVYARHLQPTQNANLPDGVYDDGWFGYGKFEPLPVVKVKALKPSKTLAVITGGPKLSGSDSGEDPDRPVMIRRHPADSGGGTASDEKGSGNGTGTTQTDTSVPANDPDRPTMRRRDTSATDSAGGTTAQTGSVPADDPDRPTLKRHSVEDAKKAKRQEEQASVTAVGSLNDDPNRPVLHRGKPASAMTEADVPKLMGMPKDLRQMAAVSDAAKRETHDFARPWTDANERAEVLAKMEAMARAQLASYGGEAAAAQPVARKAAATKTGHERTRRAVAKTGSKAGAAPALALLDEELKGFLLSYGASPTYVFTAHTAGTGAELRYVTVVAQEDAMGELKPAIRSVTDAAHLDVTPRMKLVDAVDAEASNRASLLFELREQGSRQFALYRVIGGRADQIFLTGTTQ